MLSDELQRKALKTLEDYMTAAENDMVLQKVMSGYTKRLAEPPTQEFVDECLPHFVAGMMQLQATMQILSYAAQARPSDTNHVLISLRDEMKAYWEKNLKPKERPLRPH